MYTHRLTWIDEDDGETVHLNGMSSGILEEIAGEYDLKYYLIQEL